MLLPLQCIQCVWHDGAYISAFRLQKSSSFAINFAVLDLLFSIVLTRLFASTTSNRGAYSTKPPFDLSTLSLLSSGFCSEKGNVFDLVVYALDFVTLAVACLWLLGLQIDTVDYDEV